MIRKLFCALLFLPALASAADITFTNLTQTDFENISKEMAGNFMHHSVQGAATLGNVFGFEVGLIAGQSGASKIDEIVKRSGGSGFPNLYHAGLLGVVSIPFGVTGEVVMMPKMGSGNADFQMTSAALKVNLSAGLLTFLPFNLAVRGVTSSAKLNFAQSSGGTEIKVANETTTSGLQLLVGPSLPLIEPYAGVGFLSGKNSLTATGGTVFDPSYTTGQSSDNSVSSTQTILGVTANLLLLRLGAEYSNAFGNSSYTAKLAFGF